VKPYLDEAESIEEWKVDTTDTRKVLTVTGENLTVEQVSERVAAAGFDVIGQIEDLPNSVAIEHKTFLDTYKPLILVFSYVLGTTLLTEFASGRFDILVVMSKFMGGFFLVFSFFKILNLNGFANAFQSYDIIARRSRYFALVYPFIELTLGLAYLLNVIPLAINVITFAIMLIGLAGVAQALMQKKRIQCACLGTVFNLPMSNVTFVEDGVMALMAATMIIMEFV
jgi:hypothetical protein